MLNLLLCGSRSRGIQSLSLISEAWKSVICIDSSTTRAWRGFSSSSSEPVSIIVDDVEGETSTATSTSTFTAETTTTLVWPPPAGAGPAALHKALMQQVEAAAREKQIKVGKG